MLDRDLIGNAARMGRRLRAGLDALAARSRIIGECAGLGLLMAIELVADKATRRMLPPPLVAPARLGALALQDGLALYSRRTSGGKFGDWVMITPPLIIDAAQVDELVGLLGRVDHAPGAGAAPCLGVRAGRALTVALTTAAHSTGGLPSHAPL